MKWLRADGVEVEVRGGMRCNINAAPMMCEAFLKMPLSP